MSALSDSVISPTVIHATQLFALDPAAVQRSHPMGAATADQVGLATVFEENADDTSLGFGSGVGLFPAWPSAWLALDFGGA